MDKEYRELTGLVKLYQDRINGTKKRKRALIFNYIRSYIDKHNYPPSQGEMVRYFGCGLKEISIAVNKLADEGYLIWEKKRGKRMKQGLRVNEKRQQ